MPVSATAQCSSTIDSVSGILSAAIVMVTVPARVNLMALLTRLSKICRSRRSSPRTVPGRPSARSSTNASPFCAA